MTLGLTVTLLATGLSLATAETVLGDICKYGILSNGHRYLEVAKLKFYAEKETRKNFNLSKLVEIHTKCHTYTH